MKLRNKKTGKITEVEEINIVVMNDECDCYDSFAEYHSLAELNEEWEDYKPKEPLIKDDNIREVVRAWAKVHGDTKFDVHGGCLVTTFKGLNSLLEIDFKCSWLQNGVYTIDELCGEKE